MKFYNREAELSALEQTYSTLQLKASMTVITGRRRIGKTQLALEFIKNKPSLYLFVSKKAENLLCEEYISQIKEKFKITPHGKITEFKDIFLILLEIAKTQPLVLIIDEFQEFININSSVFSDLQKLYDLHRATSKIQIIFLGSVSSLVYKIFQSSKEPLFGRADKIINLKPFTPKEIHKILSDNNQDKIETLFDYFKLTGGIPKYIEQFINAKAFTFNQMIDYIFSLGSPLLEEGKNILIEEFGKEYGGYFSILELIASGKTNRPAIESVLQKNIGGHLERLDDDYAVIEKYKPINAKPHSRLQKYQIKDPFLRFWFRFIYSNKSTVEIGNFDFIKQIIQRDISTYDGKILESFFYELLANSNRYNKIGSYWEKDGTNEIDLVAINDLKKNIFIIEVKKNKNKINLNLLKEKALKLENTYPGYEFFYQGFSLSDAKGFL